jgi:O-Antigen ligase
VEHGIPGGSGAIAARGDRAMPPAVDRRAVRTDSFAFSKSLLLVVLLVVVDVIDAFGRASALQTGTGLRYLVLGVPIATALVLFTSSPSPLIRRPARTDLLLMTLAAFGLLGSMYGRMFLHTDTSAFPIFLPMLIGLPYLVTTQPVTREEAGRLFRSVSNIGLLYVLLHALASAGAFDSWTFESFGHWKAFFIAMAIVAAMERRGVLRTLVLSILAVYIYARYPAGTYVFVLVATALTLFVTRPRASPARAYVIGVAVAAVVTVGLLNLSGTVSLTESYFRDVGKTSNVDTRLELWSQGIEQIGTFPLVGHAFTGEMTVPISQEGLPARLALHQDYLNLALGGGVIAIGLFAVWTVFTNLAALRWIRRARVLGNDAQASLLRVLLVGFNAWLVVAAFNSLLETVGTSAALFAIYGLMMTIGLSEAPSGDPSLGGAARRPPWGGAG